MTTRLRNFLESSDPSQLSRFDIKKRLKKLSPLWDQYDQIQTCIEMLELAEPGNADDNKLHKQHADERASFETSYFNLVSRFEATLRALERCEIQENTNSQNSTVASESRHGHTAAQIRLPKIKLPAFSGNCEIGIPFTTHSFKMINANPDLSKIQKFHYLRSSLKGEAAEVIKAFEITTYNYDEAWELLIERYDNRRRIVQGHVRAMFELPPMHKENHSQLRALLDGVCKHLRTLKALERPVDSWDDLVIHLILSKLDTTTKKETVGWIHQFLVSNNLRNSFNKGAWHWRQWQVSRLPQVQLLTRRYRFKNQREQSPTRLLRILFGNVAKRIIFFINANHLKNYLSMNVLNS